MVLVSKYSQLLSFLAAFRWDFILWCSKAARSITITLRQPLKLDLSICFHTVPIYVVLVSHVEAYLDTSVPLHNYTISLTNLSYHPIYKTHSYKYLNISWDIRLVELYKKIVTECYRSGQPAPSFLFFLADTL